MKKLTAEWVRKAEADVLGAKRLAKTKPPLPDLVCFHCQQAGEKYFKALLQELGVAIPYTHDLNQLLDLLLPHDAALRAVRRGLTGLTAYAVIYRYPRKYATSRKMQTALRQMTNIRQEIRQRLGLKPPRKRRKRRP